MSRTQVQQSQIRDSLVKSDDLTIDSTLADQSDLTGDLDALRSLIRDIKGSESAWYDAATQDLSDIYAALHVGGAAATDATFQGNLTVTSDLKITGDAAAQGQLYIVGDNGEVSSESTLVYDSTTSKLTASGAGGLDVSVGGLHVEASSTFDSSVEIVSGGLDITAGGLNVDAGGATIAGDELLLEAADITVMDAAGAGANTVFSVDAATGDTVIAGTLDAGASTLASAVVSNLIDGRVVLAGTDGALQDDSKLTYTVGAGGAFSLVVDGAIDASGDVTVGDYMLLDASSGDIKVETGVGVMFNLDAASGDVTMAGDATVAGGMIKSSGAVDAIELLGSGNVEVKGDLTVAGNTIKSSSAEAIELSGAHVEVKGDLQVSGNDIEDSNGDVVLSFVGDGSKAASFAGNLTVAGDLLVQGATTTIDTANLKVKDALIHLNHTDGGEGGPSGATFDRGLVFHGDQGYDDLAFGANGGDAEFVFAKSVNDEDVDDGNSAIFASAELAGVWMQETKYGFNRGALSGSLAAKVAGLVMESTAGNEIEIKAAADLKLEANGSAFSLSAGTASVDDAAAWSDQFGSASIIEAIMSVAAGGSMEKGEVNPGRLAAVSAESAIDFSADLGFKLRAGWNADDNSMEKAADVFLNGVRLKHGAAYDYELVSDSEIELKMVLEVDDVLFMVLFNPEAV